MCALRNVVYTDAPDCVNLVTVNTNATHVQQISPDHVLT